MGKPLGTRTAWMAYRMLNHADIGPAVIQVKRRCNYTEVRKALTEGIVPDDLCSFMPMLRDLRDLSQILKDMRIRRGAIDFDFPEYKIILDTEGNPLRLEKRERSIAEQMVEESMLIANETVAAYLRNSENPSVYRIHVHIYATNRLPLRIKFAIGFILLCIVAVIFAALSLLVYAAPFIIGCAVIYFGYSIIKSLMH